MIKTSKQRSTEENESMTFWDLCQNIHPNTLQWAIFEIICCRACSFPGVVLPFGGWWKGRPQIPPHKGKRGDRGVLVGISSAAMIRRWASLTDARRLAIVRPLQTCELGHKSFLSGISLTLIGISDLSLALLVLCVTTKKGFVDSQSNHLFKRSYA
jgi:hypothetical protein